MDGRCFLDMDWLCLSSCVKNDKRGWEAVSETEASKRSSSVLIFFPPKTGIVWESGCLGKGNRCDKPRFLYYFFLRKVNARQAAR
jgi:hypothetical protein